MWKVTAYLTAGLTHSFDAKDQKHAREIAGRIVREGLWVVNPDGSEAYFPTAVLFKVLLCPTSSTAPTGTASSPGSP